MKRIMITGVAGFIGAHTLEHFLVNTDWYIIGIDSLKHRGDIRRINQVIDKNPDWSNRFELFVKDLTVPFSVNEINAFGDIDYILNLAAESHVDRSISDPVPFVKNNVDLMLNMLELSRAVMPAAFIQISTDEVYGPMEQDVPFKENDRHLPSNPYSASKSAQEMIAISYWRTYGVPLIITNTMNNIGECQDAEKFVPLVIKKLLAGEEITIHGSEQDMGSRYYLHARNHADALLFILQNTLPVRYSLFQNYPSRYNIAGDTRVGNLEMAEKIARLVQEPLTYRFDSSVRPGHDLHYGLDGSLLRSLGWNPPMPFEESLTNTVKNYLEHKEWLA